MESLETRKYEKVVNYAKKIKLNTFHCKKTPTYVA